MIDEFNKLKVYQRNILLIISITIPFLYLVLYFITPSIVSDSPVQIAIILAFCLSVLLTLMNILTSFLLVDKLFCYLDTPLMGLVTPLLNIFSICLCGIIAYKDNWRLFDFCTLLMTLTICLLICMWLLNKYNRVNNIKESNCESQNESPHTDECDILSEV